tara:strand:+ start:227 stop:850 length:624 start_codon:yes stop_codon:yes gene_type:complete
MANISEIELPDELPIFPLSGALLLPRALLPLNIFEQRYIQMIDDALREQRIIGMVQPQNTDGLYSTGCAGRIISFEETEGGRYLISLKGISRFKIINELDGHTPYRRAEVSWNEYTSDMQKQDCPGFKKEKFLTLLEKYFDFHGLSADWELIKNTPDEKLISALSMICPFDNREKQALLEASCCESRADLMTTLLEMAQHENNIKDQ